MPVSCLTPDDVRVSHHSVPIDDHVYHYVQSLPPSPIMPRGTILLLHGWPDTALTWRHQIPMLTSPPLSLRVIAPDMLGYGQTSAPEDPAEYSLKRMSGHMKALVEHVLGGDDGSGGDAQNGSQKQQQQQQQPQQQQQQQQQQQKKTKTPLLLGGHDWGAALAWRMAALWTPNVFDAVVCLNVPYLPPDTGAFIDLKAYVAAIPSLRYQVQLAGDQAVQIIDDPSDGHANLRGFINGIYDGHGPQGEEAFTVDVGVQPPAVLRSMGPAKLMGGEWVDYYVTRFAARSFRGPTNWYRTRAVNYEDEKGMMTLMSSGDDDLDLGLQKIGVPCMVVMGERDEALPPSLADGMERWFGEGLLRKEIVEGGGHWAHWEKAERVNGLLEGFLGSVFLGG